MLKGGGRTLKEGRRETEKQGGGRATNETNGEKGLLESKRVERREGKSACSERAHDNKQLQQSCLPACLPDSTVTHAKLPSLLLQNALPNTLHSHPSRKVKSHKSEEHSSSNTKIPQQQWEMGDEIWTREHSYEHDKNTSSMFIL